MAKNIIEYILDIQSKGAQKSLLSLSKASAKTDISLKKVSGGLTKTSSSASSAKTSIASFGKKGLAIAGPLGSAITGIKSAFSMLGGAIGTATAFIEDYTKKVYELTKSNVDAINHLNDLANKSGISAKAIQGIGLAFEASGQSIGDAESALESFPRQLVKLQKEGTRANDLLKKLGIPDTGTNEEILTRIIRKIQEIEDPSTRAKVATELLGRSAKKMLQAFATSAPLEKFNEIAKDFGVNAELGAEAAATFQQALAVLRLALRGLVDRFVTSIGGMDLFKNALKGLVFAVVFVGKTFQLFGAEIQFLGKLIFLLVKEQIMKAIGAFKLFAKTMGVVLIPAVHGMITALNKELSFMGKKKINLSFIKDYSNRLSEAKSSALDAMGKIDELNTSIKTNKEFTKKAADALDELDDKNKKTKSSSSSLAKSQERAKEKLKELIAEFKDGDRTIKATMKATRKLSREFIKLQLPTKEIEAFSLSLSQMVTDQEFAKIDSFVEKMKDLESLAVEIKLDTEKALSDYKGFIRQAKIEGSLNLTAQIVSAASGDSSAVQGLITKIFGSTGGAVAGVGGALAGFGGRMKEVGQAAVQKAEEDLNRPLTAKEQKEIIHEARIADAKQRVKDFADNIAIAIEMLPEILLNVLPPAIVNGTINILKALAGLPSSIGKEIAKFLKSGFSTIKEGAGKGASVTLDVLKEVFTLGFAETETFNSKRTGGRIPSAFGGMRFTGPQKSGLAMLHENEFVVPASGQVPQSVDRQMRSMNQGGITVNVSGMVVESNAVDQIVREIERRFSIYGTSESSLFRGS